MTNQDLITENDRLSNVCQTLSADLMVAQRDLNDTLNNLALADAELRNLRTWRELASRERYQSLSTNTH